MSTVYHHLSDYDSTTIPKATDMRFGIVVAEWNENITSSLLKGALDTLKKNGAKEENIIVQTVPGSYELTYGAARMIKSGKVDAVIAIGCVVRGETPHFDYICEGVTNGPSYLNANSRIPVIFCLLTTNTMQQAKERSGGKLGNKGTEGAVTAIKMIHFQRKLEQR